MSGPNNLDWQLYRQLYRTGSSWAGQVLPAELLHDAALRWLRSPLGERLLPAAPPPSPLLAQRLWGRSFASPLGLAAGLDKNGVAIASLLKLGFGFIEIGSVTAEAHRGNPKPRLFRLDDDRALINRIGLYSDGRDVVAERLRSYRQHASREHLVGVSLASHKPIDSSSLAHEFELGLRACWPYVDYLCLNISCPNVPQHHPSDPPQYEALTRLLDALNPVRQELKEQWKQHVPLLLKLGPDLDDDNIRTLAQCALHAELDGLIAVNTTLKRPAGLRCHQHRQQDGGLSGAPLAERAREVVGLLYRTLDGALPIIGVGGISSAEDAYQMIRAGASLVQVYSSFVFQGPSLPQRINRELAARLSEDQYADLSEAIGFDQRRRLKL